MLLKWFDRLASGTVIDKLPYGPPGQAVAVPLTKLNAILYEGTAPPLSHPPDDSGTWILRVRGADKRGRPLTQNKYVDEMTFNNTQIGDLSPHKAQ